MSQPQSFPDRVSRGVISPTCVPSLSSRESVASIAASTHIDLWLSFLLSVFLHVISISIKPTLPFLFGQQLDSHKIKASGACSDCSLLASPAEFEYGGFVYFLIANLTLTSCFFEKAQLLDVGLSSADFVKSIFIADFDHLKSHAYI